MPVSRRLLLNVAAVVLWPGLCFASSPKGPTAHAGSSYSSVLGHDPSLMRSSKLTSIPSELVIRPNAIGAAKKEDERAQNTLAHPRALERARSPAALAQPSHSAERAKPSEASKSAQINDALPGAIRLSTRSSRFSLSPAGPDDFKFALERVFEQMLDSYKTQVQSPLSIHVLDTSVPSVQKFFQSSTVNRGGKFDPHTVLALSYDPSAKINGQSTAACMVQYNSERRMHLLSGYEHAGLFNKQEIIYYLAAHEFGHCMAFHQAMLGKGPALNAKDHEYMADKVAVAFFHINGQLKSAQSVIEFNAKHVHGPLHSHPEKLASWYWNLKQYLADTQIKQAVNSMADLYLLAARVPE